MSLKFFGERSLDNCLTEMHISINLHPLQRCLLSPCLYICLLATLSQSNGQVRTEVIAEVSVDPEKILHQLCACT